MEIIDISHNDDLQVIAQKCNTNFKQLAFSASQGLKKQGRTSDSSAEAMISAAVADISNVIVPNEVAGQIQAQGIPQMVSNEVAAQMPIPPIGSYLMTQTDPASIYPSTTWQQSDTVTTDGSTVIPLWERTA